MFRRNMLFPYSAELMVRPVKCSVFANDIFLKDERKIKVKLKRILSSQMTYLQFQLTLYTAVVFANIFLQPIVSCDFTITFTGGCKVRFVRSIKSRACVFCVLIFAV